MPFPPDVFIRRKNLDPDVPVSVKDISAAGDGEIDDYVALSDAQRKVGADGTLYFPGPATYRIGTNLTFSQHCIFGTQATLDPDAGVTVTLSGPVETVPGGGVADPTALGTVTVTGPRDTVLVQTVNDSTTLDNADDMMLVDASGASVTITLPAAASTDRRLYHIKKIDSSANTVIVDGNGSETIDGATTITITLQYESVTVATDGSAWYIQ